MSTNVGYIKEIPVYLQNEIPYSAPQIKILLFTVIQWEKQMQKSL